jgi:hypothetical protein
MGILQKILRREVPPAPAPPMTALSVLEELHQGRQRDYCLYLRPTHTHVHSDGQAPADLESLIITAFAPLAVLPVEPATALPQEAFLTLADSARVLWLTPIDDPTFISRLQLLRERGPIDRCIFLMPEAGTFGGIDWPNTWAATRAKVAELGIELSAYTAGGWLFRLDADGKACTFRPIANPNVEKIARALETICEQMQ